MEIWDNKPTLTEYFICDSPIIQIFPSGIESNLYVFTEDGHVHHLDGYNFKIIESFSVSKNALICVEEVSIKNSIGFLVADDEGNLFRFDTSFKNPKKLGKRKEIITAMECVGKNRVITARQINDKTACFEMISPCNGKIVAQLDVDGIGKIRDMRGPTLKQGLGKGWVIAVSNKEIATINHKTFQLELKRLIRVRPEFYIDEVACDAIEQKLAGKNVPEDTTCADAKCSTISWEYGIKAFTEFNNLYIKGRCGKINKYVDLGEDEVISKNMHFPEGRICCGTNDGRLLVVDFRMNSVRFIFDA